MQENKISLSEAHAALDNLATAPNLLAQVTAAKPTVNDVVDAIMGTQASKTASWQQQPVGSGVVSNSQIGAEADLLTVVRTKLARVASEFGIPYATVRDFFVSHL
jgi:hypothetical protein